MTETKPDADNEPIENMYEIAINTIRQKLQDKSFLKNNDISFHNAQKVLAMIDTILSNKDYNLPDGNQSFDGYTMKCPKHGYAPVHFCLVGDKKGNRNKRVGKCRYFDGVDATHGICTAPESKEKRYIGEPKYTHGQAFILESNYRMREKEVLNDLSPIKGKKKNQKGISKEQGVSKAIATKSKRTKSVTDCLPGKPKPATVTIKTEDTK